MAYRALAGEHLNMQTVSPGTTQELSINSLANTFSAEQVVQAGNKLLDRDESADAWEVASGLLAGAIQFWLYSRQPCDDPLCPVAGAQDRWNPIFAGDDRTMSEDAADVGD